MICLKLVTFYKIKETFYRRSFNVIQRDKVLFLQAKTTILSPRAKADTLPPGDKIPSFKITTLPLRIKTILLLGAKTAILLPSATIPILLLSSRETIFLKNMYF